MHRVLLIFLLVLISVKIFSQSGIVRVENNGTVYSLDNNDVTSDFGRREVGSKWHDGLDVSGASGGCPH